MAKPKTKSKTEDVKKGAPLLTQDMRRLLDIRKDSELWKQIIASNMRENSTEGSDKDIAYHSQLEQPHMKARLDQLVAQSNIPMNYGELKVLLENCFGEPFKWSGFDPYGSEDESGLHEGNADPPEQEDDQGDYEIEEVVESPGFSYDYAPTHHIEVEVNSGPPGSDTPENEASCEFTFEYHRNGKLVQSKQVPSSTQLEDKLRSLSLMNVPSVSCGHGKKKKRPAAKNDPQRKVIPGSVDDSLCVLCQYEAFFGEKPTRTIDWLEEKAVKEEERRESIKEKLHTAKMRTLGKHGFKEEENA